jgi:hypothetical protein
MGKTELPVPVVLLCPLDGDLEGGAPVWRFRVEKVGGRHAKSLCHGGDQAELWLSLSVLELGEIGGRALYAIREIIEGHPPLFAEVPDPMTKGKSVNVTDKKLQYRSKP